VQEDVEGVGAAEDRVERTMAALEMIVEVFMKSYSFYSKVHGKVFVPSFIQPFQDFSYYRFVYI